MFALKALTPLLNALDEIEAGYRDGKISREELNSLGDTMSNITSGYYWKYVLDNLITEWVERYKTNMERALEEEERQRAKAEAKAAAEVAAIEAAKPKMIPYLPDEES